MFFAQKDTVIHLLYDIEPADSMVYFNKVRVHKQCYSALKKMIEDAKKENIYIGIRSAYRDSAEQAYQFYYLGDLYKQTIQQRLKHTAPPKYSEHHTGFAIDFMDLQYPNVNYGINFEKTPTFKWLQKNACRYGFVLSFPPNNKQNIQYEPWHWRYEGNEYARSKFEKSYLYRYSNCDK
ncbi:MAG: D-alanyl-D-alanine carboxypeptidase family protein [Bacteroidia bacterium]|nr:D-alanyl-D-alanine carboxypeptidase family protein [Bacteroidia bacterium]MDW8347505.1 D-alanyl-D-alanine carboxypeptidase family protein [Bacteroidia bacterium]